MFCSLFIHLLIYIFVYMKNGDTEHWSFIEEMMIH